MATIDPVYAETDNYISGLFTAEDPVLSKVRASIEKNGLEDLSVSANQGKFLHLLARLCSAQKILEIGTFAGYSTIWLARALRAGGKVVTIERDSSIAEIAQANFDLSGLNSLIDLMVGNAIDILQEITAANIAPFDMIFIDADKPNYPVYFQWALKLARPGTLIVADNVIRHIIDENANREKKLGVQQFNKMLAENKCVTASIIQTVGIKEHDGMAIAVVN